MTKGEAVLQPASASRVKIQLLKGALLRIELSKRHDQLVSNWRLDCYARRRVLPGIDPAPLLYVSRNEKSFPKR